MTSLPSVPSMTSSLSVPTIVASDLASVELLVAMVSVVGKRFTVIQALFQAIAAPLLKQLLLLR